MAITRAQMRRQLRRNGGIMNAVPRQGYFLGSVGRAIGKAVGKVGDVAKQVVKSPVGRAALLGAGIYGLGGGFGPGSFGWGNIGPSIGRGLGALKGSLFGMQGIGGPAHGAREGILGKLGLTGGWGAKKLTPLGWISGASLLGYFTQKGATEEEAKELAQDVYRGKGLGMDQIRADIAKYKSGEFDYPAMTQRGYDFLTPRPYLAAQGGRVGLYAGTQKKKKSGSKAPGPHKKTKLELLKEERPTLFSDTTTSIEGSPKKKKYTKGRAQGGRIGYAEGTEESQEYIMDAEESMAIFKVYPKELSERQQNYLYGYKKYAKGGRIGKFGGGIGVGMPRIPTGIPRVNAGGIRELDYRQEGGYVPMGVKEKADDVPAMLSKNEFVMTADAVKGAGGGSVEKGAQRMYDTMKRLENRIA